VLLVHELHEVRGREEDAFEEAVRTSWLPALARDRDVRLLYFLKHAHGSGASYRVVTITALRDAAAWGRTVERVDAGDLRDEARALDALRHDVTAKVLVPLPWSPLQSVDLAAVPAEASARHELTLFMEDTVWPDEDRLETYVERSGDHYLAEMRRNAERGGTLLAILGGFRTAFGAGRRREIVLWQKVSEPRGLRPLLTSEVPAHYKQPGTWMHDALALRDRWESRLLRSVDWSPWY
jgi:hypothetical protein